MPIMIYENAFNYIFPQKMNRKKNNRNLIFYTILAILGVVNTFMNIGILTFVSSVIQNQPLVIYGQKSSVLFSILVATSFVLNRFFQKKIIAFSNQIIYENEVLIFNTIKHTNQEKIQRIGQDKIYTVIEDLRLFSYLPNVIVTSIVSLGTIGVCIVYFTVISLKAALTIAIAVVVILAVFYFVNKRVIKKVEFLRKIGEAYYKILEDVLNGYKELKMSSVRLHNAFGFLVDNRKKTRDLEIETANIMLTNNLFGNYGIFVLLGVIIYVLPMVTTIDRSQIISLVVILLFISTPLQNLAALQSFYNKAIVAKSRISNFKSLLKEVQTSENVEVSATGISIFSEFKSLEFKDVCYEHKDQNHHTLFKLGPLNLTIRENEILFITGGNGSGKSTFIDLLTGLKYPTSGTILLNNKKVDTSKFEYRNLISAIFTNNYLFNHNYEDYSLNENIIYQQLIHKMDMDQVVQGQYTEEAARRPFSKGQSKRMSMIFSLLEQKPIMVLDEWAADQDPHFRKYFYESLLHDFKKQQKTIIAVTHDDAYFNNADRIIKFDCGQIVEPNISSLDRKLVTT